VIVSSLAYLFGEIKWHDMTYERDYDGFKAYSNSKLANIFHCHQLSKRLEGKSVKIYFVCMHVLLARIERCKVCVQLY